MEVHSTRDAALLLRPMVQGEHECCATALIDEQRRVLRTLVSRGRLDNVDVPLAAILAEAVRLRASALIVAHNHPSGEARFSAADIAATRRVADLARALGMRLDDHLLFAGLHCSSMRVLGLL